MVGWHHQLDGHEFEQAPGVGDGQESLASCNSWGHKELDTTEQLNWTELHILKWLNFILPYINIFFLPVSTCYISSVQSLSHVQLFVTLWTAACQASLPITNSRNLLKLMSIESVMPSNHLILCRPLLFPPSIFPSIRVFSSESVLHIRWPKY